MLPLQNICILTHELVFPPAVSDCVSLGSGLQSTRAILGSSFLNKVALCCKTACSNLPSFPHLFVTLHGWKVRQKATRGVLIWVYVNKCNNYSKIKSSKEQCWQYYLYYLNFSSSALGCDTDTTIMRRVWRDLLYGSWVWWDVPIEDGSKILHRIIWQTSSI